MPARLLQLSLCQSELHSNEGEKYGITTWLRTKDLLTTSPALYQLSCSDIRRHRMLLSS